jgi:hypothetical protein
MAAPVLPPCNGTFLEQYGTPTLLWRMLSVVGYTKIPRYTWTQSEPLGDMPWYEVVLVVPPHPTNPLWRGWYAESDGRSPWEAAQVTDLDMIMEIAQNFGDELVGGPAASLPRIAPSVVEWTQDVG